MFFNSVLFVVVPFSPKLRILNEVIFREAMALNVKKQSRSIGHFIKLSLVTIYPFLM
jgi:hypothetical protein